MSIYPKVALSKSILLWFLAALIMLAAVIYQRKTGPTYPLRGEVEIAGMAKKYKLIRSDWSIKSNDAARVILPSFGDDLKATLQYKRFRTADEFSLVHFEKETNEDGEEILVALLPAQPAAGKLEYFLQLEKSDGEMRIPADKENIIIRFKDNVPTFVLAPHVIMMFFSVLIGMRAGLGAIWAPGTMRRWSWVAFIGMTIGGMVLGPFVQKYAFGEFWTGFPWGSDWTDNKMLLMWVAWLVAVAVIGFKEQSKESLSRWIIVIASIVMTGVYLIPHSMGGSELNYEAVDQGLDPSKAITTGKK